MIIYLYGFLIALVGFIIGVIYIRRKYRNILSKGTGRFGIIKYSTGYNVFFIEVEEIETAGEYTKVRLIDIYKNATDNDKTRSDLLVKASFNEWTLTNSIIWFDNNSQKVRDKKLNEILGNG